MPQHYAHPSIRPLMPGDVPAALAIQSASYPAFLQEGEAAFASRITLPASHCLAATDGTTLVGYLLAHGWAAGAPPPVGAVLTGDSAGEVLFLHDLAVAAAGRGRGIGRALVAHAFGSAARQGLNRAELIAVEGAAEYWRTLGFLDAPVSPRLAEKVRGYGPDARWMACAIPPARADTGSEGS